MARKRNASPNNEWNSVNDRILWLVTKRFAGSRTALSKAIHYSHTSVAEVVKGAATPSLKMLTAIEEQLHVNSMWLRDGTGQPFPEEATASHQSGIPVTTLLLPGPPLQHQELLTERWLLIPHIVGSASQYWLILLRSQPITQTSHARFRSRDHLLMETDAAKFPKPDRFYDHLCVVRLGKDRQELRLASVKTTGGDEGVPYLLEADFFTSTPKTPDGFERTYRHSPKGDVIGYTEKPILNRNTYVLEDDSQFIRYTDIVAVWTQVLYCPFN